MPSLPVMPIYAALLALLFIYLSVRTIGVRRRLQIALGDKNQPEMQRAVRVHANFAEYVPLGLILLHLVEARTPPGWLLHALCLLLLAGRVLHAYGVSQVKERFQFRVSGMAMTFTSLGGSALYILQASVRAALGG
jgi:uncharacterized membrane protein YecN with MAPEG domain